MVSFADLQSPDGEEYESELVRIEGVSFQNPSATGGTLNSDTDYTVEDGQGTPFPYRVEGSDETDVIGATIPNGTFNYEGVLGQSTTSGSDDGYQLVPVRTSSGLPVEMARFDAVSSGSTVELTWQTASETNNAGFHVQRKTGEETWTDLGFVESTAPGGTAESPQAYRYVVEKELEPGTHRFRLEQVDLDGTPHLSRVETVEMRMEEALRLSAPAPNPVAGRATVSFAVREAAETTIAVYNVLGQRVRTLYDGTPQQGETTDLTFDARGLSSGTYFLRMQTGENVVSRRLTVVK
jgi:hypothetical protein